MYMDEEFQDDLNVNKYVMKNEMLYEEDHRMHMYQDLKDYCHLN
jgi:hypothetical protein